MAKEYIDRNLAAEFLYRSINADPEGKCENCHITRRDCEYEQIFTRMDICGRIDDVIADIPAADVVPVVRCKDCKHSAVDFENMRYCKLVTYYNHVPDDWFCADGEREDGDGDV